MSIDLLYADNLRMLGADLDWRPWRHMDDKRVRRLGRCIGAALFWDLDNGHAADALRNAQLATNWLSG